MKVSLIRTVKSVSLLCLIAMMFLAITSRKVYQINVALSDYLVVLSDIGKNLLGELNNQAGTENDDENPDWKIPANAQHLWAYYDPRFDVVSVLSVTKRRPHNCTLLDNTGNIICRSGKATLRNKWFIHCSCTGDGANRTKLTRKVLLLSDLTTKPKFDPIPIRRTPDALDPGNRNLAVCMAPLWGNYDYTFLLFQFIEWHRLVGATKLILYYYRTENAFVNKVVEYYGQNDSFVDVIRLPQGGQCLGTHACRHDFQVNECVQRTLHRFRYVATIDVDEILLPALHHNLVHFIEYSFSVEKLVLNVTPIKNRKYLADLQFFRMLSWLRPKR